MNCASRLASASVILQGGNVPCLRAAASKHASRALSSSFKRHSEISVGDGDCAITAVGASRTKRMTAALSNIGFSHLIHLSQRPEYGERSASDLQSATDLA